MEKENPRTAIHNDPAWLSRFIGREKEKADVQALLYQTRLLTLTGPGGCGKTRLALEVAREMQVEYTDGVWLVELGSLLEADRIAQAAAAALGIVESSDRPALQRLLDHLREKQFLLVLDNCEHLIDACAQFARTLLAACPDLHILSTSREPLHIAGETTWLVPSLSLPDMPAVQPADLPLEDLLQSEAVQLFIDRARRARPDFRIDAPNTAPAVLQICRQVDGIPLAIELAAARVNILSVGEIAAQITGAFHWLENSDRLAPQRQQTLAAAVDWSYNLLDEAEQCLFRRLAVFIGGFGLEAAAAVGAEGVCGPADVLALLARLVDKSFLVRGETSGGESRYRMLEIVRQYGLERLSQAGEEQAVRTRHLHWCLDFARMSKDRIQQSQRSTWVPLVELELPNMRQALAWSISGSADPALGHELANQLGQFWQLRGFFREALGWIETLLDHRDGVPSDVLANTFDTGGFMAQHLWNYELAVQYTQEAIRLWKAGGNQERTAWGANMLGWIFEREGDYARAQEYAAESLALYGTLNVTNLGHSGAMLLASDLAYLQGDLRAAEQHIQKSLDMALRIDNMLAYTRRQTRLAQILTDKGSLSRARALLKESLEATRESDDRWNMAMILVGLVHLNAAQGRLHRAAHCLGAVQVFLEWFGANLWPVDRILFEKDFTRIKDSLSEAVFQTALQEGRGQGLDVRQAAGFAAQMLEDPPPQNGGRRAGQSKETLTKRELEIAILIAQGKNNTEIAESLFLGVRTIEAHITHILTKLGFSSRTQIAVWAVQKGFN